MDPLVLARLQFGITTVYHFFFVPLTLGLSVLVALMETLYVRSGKEIYLQMTKFWGKLFLINFAMGVVTGIVQEFQFGMNWSEYSRFVGDIFGAPLAIEALLAFFLESTFLGIWIFGWDKLSKGLHAAVMWLVAIGSNLSALWILIANSFMQEPVGYTINQELGRAEMANFFDLIFNPNVGVQFIHTVLAGFTTAAFFVLGISAYHMIRKNHLGLFKRSFKIGAIFGTIFVLLLILNGHSQAQHMVASQPMKMAAAEALWQTESPASFSLLTIGDLSQRREIFSIRIPYVLCLMAYSRLDCTVEGVYNLQAQFEQEYGSGNYIPPVAVIYWSFRIMVGAGFLMAGLALYAMLMWMGKVSIEQPRILKLFVWAIALPYLANTTGWLMTEIGRSPWVVYGLMKLEDAVSPIVSSGQALITLIGFTLLYGALMVATVYLLVKYAKAGPATGEAPPDAAEELALSLVQG
ncbi:MAG: cytochrome ubiquinol oxidase subunit I [Anaerolineales bacterium]|nr:cytochrome ubiquinol oxidase subunit I [Anaerolineales bacterium]